MPPSPTRAPFWEKEGAGSSAAAHADVITLEGESYRRRAAEEAATARKAKTKR